MLLPTAHIDVSTHMCRMLPFVKPGACCAQQGLTLHRRVQAVAADAAAQDGEDAGGDTDESGWETASDADGDAPAAGPGGAAPAASANGAHAATGQPAPGGAPAAGAGAGATEWDVRQSLFDAHAAPSMAANLEYMWKRFGFYFPEAEHLADPEGLLKYLVRGGRWSAPVMRGRLCRLPQAPAPFSCCESLYMC
jgi:hypothetical protein